MTRRLGFFLSVTLGVVLAAGRGVAADTFTADYPKVKFIAWTEDLNAVAKSHDVPISGLDLPPGRDVLLPGDSVTGVVALQDGETLTQWLVELVVDDASADKALSTPKPPRVYTNAGSEISFTDDQVTLAVRVFGPIDASGTRPVEEHRTRVAVNRDLLSLGLDEACAGALILREKMSTQPELRSFKYQVRTKKPFDAQDVENAQAAILALGFTPARERAMIGAAPALAEFWKLLTRTPGLREILPEVVDAPSGWALLRNGGKLKPTVRQNFAAAIPMKLTLGSSPGGNLHGFGFTALLEINRDAAMACTLFVVEPRPPLQATGGIVWMAAQRPDGRGPQLTFQVAATRLARNEDRSNH